MPEDHQYLFHFLLSSLQLRLGCQRFLVRLPVIFRTIKPAHYEACLHQMQQPGRVTTGVDKALDANSPFGSPSVMYQREDVLAKGRP